MIKNSKIKIAEKKQGRLHSIFFSLSNELLSIFQLWRKSATSVDVQTYFFLHRLQQFDTIVRSCHLRVPCVSLKLSSFLWSRGYGDGEEGTALSFLFSKHCFVSVFETAFLVIKNRVFFFFFISQNEERRERKNAYFHRKNWNKLRLLRFYFLNFQSHIFLIFFKVNWIPAFCCCTVT